MPRPGRTVCRDQAPPRRKCAILHIFGQSRRAGRRPVHRVSRAPSVGHVAILVRSGLGTIESTRVSTDSVAWVRMVCRQPCCQGGGPAMDPEYENSRFSKFTTITTSLTECTRTVRRARPDRMRSPALAFGGWPGWLLPLGGLPGPRCNFRVWRRPVAPSWVHARI